MSRNIQLDGKKEVPFIDIQNEIMKIKDGGLLDEFIAVKANFPQNLAQAFETCQQQADSAGDFFNKLFQTILKSNKKLHAAYVDPHVRQNLSNLAKMKDGKEKVRSIQALLRVCGFLYTYIFAENTGLKAAPLLQHEKILRKIDAELKKLERNLRIEDIIRISMETRTIHQIEEILILLLDLIAYAEPGFVAKTPEEKKKENFIREIREFTQSIPAAVPVTPPPLPETAIGGQKIHDAVATVIATESKLIDAPAAPIAIIGLDESVPIVAGQARIRVYGSNDAERMPYFTGLLKSFASGDIPENSSSKPGRVLEINGTGRSASEATELLGTIYAELRAIIPRDWQRTPVEPPAEKDIDFDREDASAEVIDRSPDEQVTINIVRPVSESIVIRPLQGTRTATVIKVSAQATAQRRRDGNEDKKQIIPTPEEQVINDWFNSQSKPEEPSEYDFDKDKKPKRGGFLGWLRSVIG